MKVADKQINEQPLTYEILDNGYQIYLGGKVWIEQIGSYSKPFDKEKSFEENCLIHIDELTEPIITPEIIEPYGIEKSMYNQIIDDYTLELIAEGGGELGEV